MKLFPKYITNNQSQQEMQDEIEKNKKNTLNKNK